MDTLGHHFLAEYWGCEHSILNDSARIEALLIDAAKQAGATIVGVVFHQFSPQGVSGVVVIEESHLSIHTWPEHGYAAVDFYTCGNVRPQRACDIIHDVLGADRHEIVRVKRGLPQGILIESPHPDEDPIKVPSIS